MNNSVTEIQQEICEFCGHPIIIKTTGPGRKTRFHHRCGQINRSLAYAFSQIATLPMTDVAADRLRKRLFYVANSTLNQPRDEKGRFQRVG